MNNRRYEKIKELVKVAREELIDSLEMTESMVDRTLKVAIKESKGDYVAPEDFDFFMGMTNSLEDYILISTIAEEIVNFMEGGPLPEEA